MWKVLTESMRDMVICQACSYTPKSSIRILSMVPCQKDAHHAYVSNVSDSLTQEPPSIVCLVDGEAVSIPPSVMDNVVDCQLSSPYLISSMPWVKSESSVLQRWCLHELNHPYN